MNARLLSVIISLTLTACLYWFAGTARSDDDDYSCYTPDGAYYESAVPCSSDYNYYDYDYYYPGFGYYFDFDGHSRFSDNDRDRDHHSGGHGGGMHAGGGHGGGGH